MGRDRARGADRKHRRDEDGEPAARLAPDRHALLRLQGAAGNRAVAAGLAAARSGVTVQRKFTSHAADSVDTAAELIKATYKVNKNQQSLPGNQPLGTVDRPRAVEAVIDKKSLRKKERKKDSKLAVVTSLARAEQMMLQGADIRKFYDAGHLVADQLVGEAANSFEFWNLAPQVSEFNTPAYAGVEEEIRASLSAARDKIMIRVQLEYPADYSMNAAELVRRRIIPPGTHYPTRAITVARRIPNLWTLTAQSLTPTSAPGAVRVPDDPAAPTLGAPYDMKVTEYVAPVPFAGPTLKANLKMRHLLARQWTPSPSVRIEDAISLLVKTFPDLGNQADIVRKLAPSGTAVVPDAQIALMKQAAGGVARALLEVQTTLLESRDPTLLQPMFSVIRNVQQQLTAAEQPSASLVEATGHLVTAQSWVEDLHEELVEAVEKQQEQYPFPLSTVTALHESAQAWSQQWSLSVSQASPAYQPSSEEEGETIEARQSLADARDVTKDPGISRVTDFGNGTGQLMWSRFGFDAPVYYGETITIPIKEQAVTVVVQHLNPLTGDTGLPTGEWLVGWKYPGA
jgi:hypothetical protein